MLSSSKSLQIPGGDIRLNFVLNSSRLVLVKVSLPRLQRADSTWTQEVFALQRITAESKRLIKTIQPTAEDIRSLDSAKKKLGLPRSAKVYTNTSTPTPITGTPCATTERAEDHTWENESHKLINTTPKSINTISQLLAQLNN